MLAPSFQQALQRAQQPCRLPSLPAAVALAGAGAGKGAAKRVGGACVLDCSIELAQLAFDLQQGRRVGRDQGEHTWAVKAPRCRQVATRAGRWQHGAVLTGAAQASRQGDARQAGR